MSPSSDSPRLSSGVVHVMVRSPAALVKEIHQALSERTIFPAHVFYETRGGSANWTELTADSTYASATDSAALFRNEGDGIGCAIAEVTGEKPVCIVSLGPGSGWKEELVIGAIMHSAASCTTVSLRYYALDTSPILATQAMTRVLTSDALARDRVHAAAFIARFDDLPALAPLYETGDAVNVVMLLGNTLGNLADELGLLTLVSTGAMKQDDLLLLEVTLRQPGTDEIASLGQLLTIKRFNFEPLAAIGVRYVPDHLTYRVATDRSTIPGTLTVVANYRDFVVNETSIRSADIAYVHRYETAAVAEVLSKAGFSICRPPWFGPNRRSMLVLARRAHDRDGGGADARGGAGAR